MTDVLDTGFRVCKFYGPRRKLKRLENKGFEVLDDGKDERGHYWIIGTHEPALVDFIDKVSLENGVC